MIVGEYRPREQGLRHILNPQDGRKPISVGEYRPREQGLRLRQLSERLGRQ